MYRLSIVPTSPPGGPMLHVLGCSQTTTSTSASQMLSIGPPGALPYIVSSIWGCWPVWIPNGYLHNGHFG